MSVEFRDVSCFLHIVYLQLIKDGMIILLPGCDLIGLGRDTSKEMPNHTASNVSIMTMAFICPCEHGQYLRLDFLKPCEA